MDLDFQERRKLVHKLIDRLAPAQLEAVRGSLEVLVDDDAADEDLTEDDRVALRASDEYFRNGGQGIPIEEVLADFGLTMADWEEMGKTPIDVPLPVEHYG